MMMTDLVSLLRLEASERERQAINLFCQAREGKDIDNKKLLSLDKEAKIIRKALELLK